MSSYPKVTVSTNSILERTDKYSYTLLGEIFHIDNHWLVVDISGKAVKIFHKLSEVREWAKLYEILK